MPPWIGESPNNLPRAAAIAATLLNEDYDVLCLQKVFDNAARTVLEGALAARYPYRYGPANDWCSLKLNSGVWVLSRRPMSAYQEMAFDECRGVECFSRKGAISLSGMCGETPFHLITTHLQGEEEPRFTIESQRVRDAQTAAIRDRFVTPHLTPAAPFIFCGDLGTPRFTENGRHETLYYHRLLTTLGAVNGCEPRITIDDTRARNDLATDDTGRRNEVDYVLLRENGYEVAVDRAVLIFRRPGWDEARASRSNLSYRYAVGAKITFGLRVRGPT